ncbi:unnamed protein product [Caenorhabditis angaria]|uniref:Uncharacterized protein n=1 Tax=Caenorhabditis angaria TaxID=860376 RepID=A0A9P1N0S7_9PELO|nr:unnamed protein product [Caenorhabditis angaria]
MSIDLAEEENRKMVQFQSFGPIFDGCLKDQREAGHFLVKLKLLELLSGNLIRREIGNLATSKSFSVYWWQIFRLVRFEWLLLISDSILDQAVLVSREPQKT